MGKRSTITGYWRQRGTQDAGRAVSSGAPQVVTSMIKVTFDATQASTVSTGLWLPEGARVIRAYSTGEGGAGTVDVGNLTTSDVDAFASGIAASTVAEQITGAELGIPVAVGGAEISAGDNTGGTGTATIYLECVFDDDGSFAN